MKAPDKIYLQPNETGESAYVWDEKRLYGENIEYIRKDALLCWLKAVKADVMIPMNIDRVIEKIESL